MVNVRNFLRSFAGGTMSPEMFSRIDDAKQQQGVSRAENFIIRPRGAAARRPGFQFIAETKTSTTGRSRLIPFSFSSDQNLAVEIGAGYIRFHANQAKVLARNHVASLTVTFSPGSGEILASGAHGLEDGDPIEFTTTGTFPTEVSPGITYYVTPFSATSFKIRTFREIPSTTLNSFSGTGVGTHTFHFAYTPGHYVYWSGGSPGQYRCILQTTAGDVPPNATYWQFVTSGTALEIPTAYTEDDVLAIKYAQNLDVLSLAVSTWPLTELRRIGASQWTFANVLFTPVLAAPAGPSAAETLGDAHEVASVTPTTPTVVTFSGPHRMSEIDTVYCTGTIGDIATPTFAQVSQIVPGVGSNQLRLASTTTGGEYGSVAITGGGSCRVAPLNAELQQNYVVTAVASDGSEGSPSAEFTADNILEVRGAFNQLSWSSVSGADRYRVYKEVSGLFGFIGETDELTFKDDNIDPDLGTTPPIHDNTLNGTSSYPSSVGYFEQRRVVTIGSTVYMTATGTESDMSFHIPVLATDRIKFTIAARELTRIEHVIPLSQLAVLTDNTEFRVTPINDDAVTPTSISVRPQSFIGCSSVRPMIVNNSLIFEAARGSHIREMAFRQEAGGFVTGDLSMRSEHLVDGHHAVDATYTKAPYPVLWFARDDGTLLGLTYSPEEGIGAWHEHVTLGFCESVCAIPDGDEDRVYAIFRRVINGVERRYVECMGSQLVSESSLPGDVYYSDSFLVYEGSLTSTITGLGHLEGSEVVIHGRPSGSAFTTQTATVTSGAVTFTTPVDFAVVGLTYQSILRTLPLAMQVDGFGHGRTKNINKVWVRVQGGSDGAQIYQNDAPAEDFTSISEDTRELSFVRQAAIAGNWGDNGYMTIQQFDPRRLVVVGMVLEVAVGG